MSRAPNITPPRRPGAVLALQPCEFDCLKRNTPGPSGKLGGYPRHENWLLDNIDPVTLELELDAVRLERTIRYIVSYGSGGPNARIRSALVPAFRRAGIDLRAT